MSYQTLQDEIKAIVATCVVVNACSGEQTIVRGTAARLWGQVFTDPLAHRVLLKAFDKLYWNDFLGAIGEFLTGLDEILCDISNYVDENRQMNYLNLRVRLNWLSNFLGPEVCSFLRTARIRLRTTPGFAAAIQYFVDIDWIKLTHLDKNEVERITVCGWFSEFEYKEIPMKPIEHIMKVFII